MNKIELKKTKIYSLFGWKLLKTTEFYVEKNFDDIEDDTPSISITHEYAKLEGFIDD